METRTHSPFHHNCPPQSVTQKLNRVGRAGGSAPDGEHDIEVGFSPQVLVQPGDIVAQRAGARRFVTKPSQVAQTMAPFKEHNPGVILDNNPGANIGPREVIGVCVFLLFPHAQLSHGNGNADFIGETIEGHPGGPKRPVARSGQ